MAETRQKFWQQAVRQQSRQRLIKQHERNIELEKKAGIKRDYIAIEGDPDNTLSVEKVERIMKIEEDEEIVVEQPKAIFNVTFKPD